MNTTSQFNSCCGGIRDSLDTEFFKALSDPSRISILVRLAESGVAQTVTEVSACCPQNMSVVSRHLKTLRQAGIVTAEKKGKEVYYTIQTEKLVTSLRTLADAIEVCCPDGTCVIEGGLGDE